MREILPTILEYIWNKIGLLSRSIIALQDINGRNNFVLTVMNTIALSNQHLYFTFFHVFSPKCIDQLDWLIYVYVNAFGIVRGLKNFFSTSIIGLRKYKEICQKFTKSYSYDKILRCFYFLPIMYPNHNLFVINLFWHFWWFSIIGKFYNFVVLRIRYHRFSDLTWHVHVRVPIAIEWSLQNLCV